MASKTIAIAIATADRGDARGQGHPPTADELAAWAGGQLAPQARPREWHFIDSLPRTSVGKVRRFKIGTDTAG